MEAHPLHACRNVEFIRLMRYWIHGSRYKIQLYITYCRHRGGGLGMARCGARHTLIWPRMGAIAHSYCHLMLLCFWSELRGRKKTPCFDFAIPQFDLVLRHCADIRSFASIIHDAICNGPSHLRIGFWYKCCCPIPKQEKPNTIGKPHEAHHSMHGV